MRREDEEQGGERRSEEESKMEEERARLKEQGGERKGGEQRGGEKNVGQPPRGNLVQPLAPSLGPAKITRRLVSNSLWLRTLPRGGCCLEEAAAKYFPRICLDEIVFLKVPRAVSQEEAASRTLPRRCSKKLPRRGCLETA